MRSKPELVWRGQDSKLPGACRRNLLYIHKVRSILCWCSRWAWDGTGGWMDGWMAFFLPCRASRGPALGGRQNLAGDVVRMRCEGVHRRRYVPAPAAGGAPSNLSACRNHSTVGWPRAVGPVRARPGRPTLADRLAHSVADGGISSGRSLPWSPEEKKKSGGSHAPSCAIEMRCERGEWVASLSHLLQVVLCGCLTSYVRTYGLQ
jgi:hypothetical protein